MTEQHSRRENPAVVPDPVAVAYWPPDVHSVRRIVRDGAAYDEGFVFGGATWRPFGVAYRSLVPKASECTNLLAPSCPSSSHIAFGAIRIEFTFMAMGQACGAAAVLALNGKTRVQGVNYGQLKDLLLREGAVLNASQIGTPEYPAPDPPGFVEVSNLFSPHCGISRQGEALRAFARQISPDESGCHPGGVHGPLGRTPHAGDSRLSPR